MDIYKAVDGAFAGMPTKYSKAQMAILEQLTLLAGKECEREYILTDCPARNYEGITTPVSITPLVQRTQLEDN